MAPTIINRIKPCDDSCCHIIPRTQAEGIGSIGSAIFPSLAGTVPCLPLANVEAVEQSKGFQRDKKRKARAEAWEKANPEAAAKAKALFKQVLG